jgi:urate oxidase
MAGQNTLILATDYNLIQSKIASVMGEGSGTKGYGQTIASSQVGQFAKITTTQWNNLRTDILRARQHQTGQDMSSD